MRNAGNSTGGGAGVAVVVDEGFSPERSPVGRRAALAAIVLIGWLFSYSIGWQKGWMVGNSETDDRFTHINQTLKETHPAAFGLGAAGATGAAAAEAPDEPAGSA